ncbi:hypothetical protein [Hyphomonas adhaerens]|uniref:hypothetical protein n=1 Tax=Hyphomonas adhaerens TaxID=81029 RepID=UPI0012EC64B6|nr:hypothetical protein [Hyphomonas adhaerens]
MSTMKIEVDRAHFQMNIARNQKVICAGSLRLFSAPIACLVANHCSDVEIPVLTTGKTVALAKWPDTMNFRQTVRIDPFGRRKDEKETCFGAALR